MYRFSRTKLLLRLARAFDYQKDPNPEHWRTINGAKVHLDKNGNYDGGAGSKFNGRHHYGPDWRQKSALMNRLAAALHSGVNQKNVASQATNGGQSVANSGNVKAEEEKSLDKINKAKKLYEEAYQKWKKAKLDWLDSYGNGGNIAICKEKCHKAEDELAQARDALEAARNEATAKGIPFCSKGWSRFEDWFSSGNIARITIQRHSKQPTEEGIINRIAGGDQTGGSCASVAFAYIANKCGLNVLDFRGGESRELFSQKWTKIAMLDFPGIKGRSIEDIPKAPASTGGEILLGLEKGKEYYLSFGGHAAIVKNTTEGVKYLELQSPHANENGWQLLGSTKQSIAKMLHSRFAVPVRASSKYMIPLTLLEVDSFKGNKEFERIAEYFNTNESKQMKGVYGSVK